MQDRIRLVHLSLTEEEACIVRDALIEYKHMLLEADAKRKRTSTNVELSDRAKRIRAQLNALVVSLRDSITLAR